MEQSEFDATLGGNEHLPYSANSFKFATSRSVEIAAMTESILNPSKTHLIFQSLPVHMRRRVMSHNCKRLPRKLREGHMEQLKKSGLPPKQKRPSRKYRRRPSNLHEEYQRRQRRIKWLETHIWHAKRFHMTYRWGYRLAYAPCDKAFRACYRATSAHCLIQDISYNTALLIQGSIDNIRKLFSNITNLACGLSIGAKAWTSGSKEGYIHLFYPDKYPYQYIGKVNFIWECDSKVWLFIHPLLVQVVETILNESIDTIFYNYDEIAIKRRKTNSPKPLTLTTMPDSFNRFSLTGPNSHAILINTLKIIQNIEQINVHQWVQKLYSKLYLSEKHNYWQSLCKANSPSQLPPRLVLGLIVKDPRVSRPKKRTKAKQNGYSNVNIEHLINIPPNVSTSPLWKTDIHDILQENKMTNGQYIEHITKTQLVPGEVNEDDQKLQCVPVILIQRPGSQDPNYKKLGYGSGWDILIPKSYGLPFWQTFIMFGARPGGLRETENLAFEMGECYIPPDSIIGIEEENRREKEEREKYFRKPPSKRVNYNKLAIFCPFRCPWQILLQDWSIAPVNQLFVLRDKKLLTQLQDNIVKKSPLPHIENSDSCLIPIYLKLNKKGSLKRNAIICLPRNNDLNDCLMEPLHDDVNEKARKLLKKQHLKNIKQKRRHKIKLKRKGLMVLQTKKKNIEISDYVKQMRELWLPSEVTTVRRSCARDIFGCISQAAFSFSESITCALGFVTYNGLSELLQCGFNNVLVRNTTTRKYNVASIKISQVS